MTKKKLLKNILNLLLILLGITFLYPLIFMVGISFKTPTEVFNNPFGLPKVFLISNYSDALKLFDFPRYFMNSLIYTVGTILLTLILGSMFAYCVSRMRWKYSKGAIAYISLGLMIPAPVIIVPLFIILSKLHLKNTYQGLILLYSASALVTCTLMLYAFLRTLPDELEEAACIDGCNVYYSFFTIILPMLRPAIATQVVLIFISIWNEFFVAFMMIDKNTLKTLPIGNLQFFVGIGTSQWGQIGAAALMTSLPSIIVYLIFSEQIENALTAGAILK